MNEAVTVGMIVWPALAVLGVVFVLGVLAVVLTILGNAFKD